LFLEETSGEIYWNNAEYTKEIDYYARSVTLEYSIFQHKNYLYLCLCNELKAKDLITNILQEIWF